jgi:hypothetical protein
MLPTGQNNQAEQAQKEADDLPEFSLAVWAKRGLHRISIQSPSVPPSAVLLAKLARGGDDRCQISVMEHAVRN